MNAVHFEQDLMNPEVTSNEEILKQCRLIAQTSGIQTLDMRSLANAMGVSLGSLYHYFPSKQDLLLASVASIWQDIFQRAKEPAPKQDFLGYLDWLNGVLLEGDKTYPGFFALHSALFNGLSKEEGRKQRDSNFVHLKLSMKQVLQKDPRIKKEALAKLDVDEFVNVLLVSILYSQLSNITDDKVLLLLVKSTLY
jgi:TetR/AcrR family transcriptional regulator, cholesterol catabolism regulator